MTRASRRARVIDARAIAEGIMSSLFIARAIVPFENVGVVRHSRTRTRTCRVDRRPPNIQRRSTQKSRDEDVVLEDSSTTDLGVDALASAFNSDCFSGIASASQVNTNRERFGTNATPPAKTYTAWDFARRALDDLTLRVLIASGALSLVLENTLNVTSKAGDDARGGSVSWLNGAAILLAVGIIVGVETWNNLSKQRSFAALNARSDAESVVSVTRFGSPRLIQKSDVVVGDVLNLDAGDVVPADVRVVDASAFMCDQSHATGESEDVPAMRDDFVVAGSRVTSGKGTALAVAVGERSTSGKILQLTLREGADAAGAGGDALTPLQARLANLAVAIGRVGVSAAVLVGTILAASLTWDYYVSTGRGPPIESAVEYVEIIITSLTIVVVSVPEVRTCFCFFWFFGY